MPSRHPSLRPVGYMLVNLVGQLGHALSDDHIHGGELTAGGDDVDIGPADMGPRMPARPSVLEETELLDLGFRQHSAIARTDSLLDSGVDLWRVCVAPGIGRLAHLSIAQTIFPDGTR